MLFNDKSEGTHLRRLSRRLTPRRRCPMEAPSVQRPVLPTSLWRSGAGRAS